jgi:hypothetical protein
MCRNGEGPLDSVPENSADPSIGETPPLFSKAILAILRRSTQEDLECRMKGTRQIRRYYELCVLSELQKRVVRDLCLVSRVQLKLLIFQKIGT